MTIAHQIQVQKLQERCESLSARATAAERRVAELEREQSSLRRDAREVVGPLRELIAQKDAEIDRLFKLSHDRGLYTYQQLAVLERFHRDVADALGMVHQADGMADQPASCAELLAAIKASRAIRAAFSQRFSEYRRSVAMQAGMVHSDGIVPDDNVVLIGIGQIREEYAEQTRKCAVLESERDLVTSVLTSVHEALGVTADELNASGESEAEMVRALRERADMSDGEFESFVTVMADALGMPYRECGETPYSADAVEEFARAVKDGDVMGKRKAPIMVESVRERSCRLSNGTNWPLPERNWDQSASHTARYHHDRLTRNQVLYLAEVASAYEALINKKPGTARDTIDALQKALYMRALGSDEGEVMTEPNDERMRRLAKAFLAELNTLASARSCYPDDEAHDAALEALAGRWLAEAEQRGRGSAQLRWMEGT